jgi:hypothetical protein
MSTPPRRKSRGRGISEESDSPFSPYASATNRPVLRAYKVCVFGLIPFLGLVLGPAALILNAWGHYRTRYDPRFTAHGPRKATYVLGALITLTNWAGLVLMVVGWTRW